MGSLLSEDIRALQELDLIPEDVDTENLQPTEQNVQASARQQENQPVTWTERGGRTAALTWFEEMLDGSRLGRIQRMRRGMSVREDDSTRVEWEVSEYFDDGSGDAESAQTPTGSKRKIGDVGDGDDVKMQQ